MTSDYVLLAYWDVEIPEYMPVYWLHPDIAVMGYSEWGTCTCPCYTGRVAYSKDFKERDAGFRLGLF